MNVAGQLSDLTVSHEGFAFDPSTGDSYVLNQTGLTVLQGLREGLDETQIARDLSDRFDVSEPAALRDIGEFVARLKSLHLL
jgi:PqqD family protein of HPr-rel-A system